MADTSSTDFSSTDILSRTFRRVDFSSNGYLVEWIFRRRIFGLKDIFYPLYISTFNCFSLFNCVLYFHK